MTDFFGSQAFIGFVYLIASALFILSLKWMNAPPTARRGILAGEIGMVLAIGGTILQLGTEGKIEHIAIRYTWIFIALGIGTAIGIPLGMVQMTAVPQRTALSHAFGAFCVTLVGTCPSGPSSIGARTSSTWGCWPWRLGLRFIWCTIRTRLNFFRSWWASRSCSV